MKLVTIIIFFCTFEFHPLTTFGMETRDPLSFALEREISKLYGGSRVELIGEVHWVRGEAPKKINSVTILTDDSKGNVRFSVSGEERVNVIQNEGESDEQPPRIQVNKTYSEGWTQFASWVTAKVSTRRIRPGEPLRADSFINQEINLASGLAHEYRGVILAPETDLSRFEAAQTILEGQFLVSTALQRTPDVRRGDSVRIHLVSGDLTLSTMGFAEEPGFLNKQIRVMTSKGKRELSGLLQTGGVVEVNL